MTEIVTKILTKQTKQLKSLKVYLAGPMSGYPEFNFPLFHSVTTELRKKGLDVFNPAGKDVEDYGEDFTKTEGYKTGNNTKQSEEVESFNIRDVLAKDMAWICQHADAICMLPGWERSKGATAELALAKALGHIVMFWEPRND